MKHERIGKTDSSSGGALLVDPSVNGQSHILVNSGFVDIALSLYDKVTVIARDSHVEALQAYMDPAQAPRVRFLPYQNRDEVYDAYRAATGEHRFERIMFLNINYKLFFKINMLHARKGQGMLYWVGHSHFLTFEDGGVANLIKNRLKKALLFNPLFKSTFVVCGQRIKKHVDALLNRDNKVKAIFHPLGIASLSQSPAVLEPGTFSLLHINGWHEASPSKIAAIAAIEQIAARNQAIRFKDVKSSIATDQDERYFSRDYKDRLGIVSEFSYFLHLPENAYRLQASGALMDLLLTGTPVIGLRTDFGTELANIIGDYGYFFDSYADIIAFLRQADAATIIADRARFARNLVAGYRVVKELSLAQARQVLR